VASLYCNGEKIFDNQVVPSTRTGEHEIMLPLKEGRNHILLKVGRVNSEWDFSFRLEGEEVRNHKQKYYI
ncbi:hypothetical protein ACFLR8_03815, partial [Bacteroidota bacterium]